MKLLVKKLGHYKNKSINSPSYLVLPTYAQNIIVKI